MKKKEKILKRIHLYRQSDLKAFNSTKSSKEIQMGFTLTICPSPDHIATRLIMRKTIAKE